MFNREVRMDVVKRKKTQPQVETSQPSIGFAEKANIVGGILGQGIKKIGIAVCAYVILDTVRQVAVASVKE